MRKWWKTTCVLVGALCVAAGPAVADRGATVVEREALSSATGIPAECVRARVSTVDGRWARVAGVQRDGCPVGNGYLYLRRSDDVWRVVGSGPAVRQPCPVRPLPTAVAVDLDLCRERPVAVPIFSTLKVKPRAIPQGAHGIYRRLRWRRWGSRRAITRGELYYGDLYSSFTRPIKIRLSRLGSCGRRRTYRRMTVVAVRQRDRTKLSFTTGSHRLACPD